MKKLIFTSLMVLLVISFMPIPGQAITAETTSTKTESQALKPGSLIKAGTGSVYYYGADGKRYVFPNEKTYKTWFVSFDFIITIGDELLGSVPIGGNVTYKPGKKLVKIQSDPKVYYVDKNGLLRHVETAEIAKQLYGSDWMYMVDDIPDAFFINYTVGSPIKTAETTAVDYNYSINQDKELADQPDPSISQLGSIELSGTTIDATTAKLNWTVNNFYSEKGFKVVMSNQPDPVYPGNDFHYLSSPETRSDKWHDLFQSGTYYFRVCEYLDGKCGIYSNNVAITMGGTSYNEDRYIKLSGTNIDTAAKLSWTTNFKSAKGYKVVVSENTNPVYPGNDYHYLSSPDIRSDKWTGLTAGKTYHFRVCEYLGGSCGLYSNDVTVTISGSAPITDNSNGTITLSGSWNDSKGKVILNWNVNNMYSTKGFKVVKSNEPNPVYPGNDYHYLSNPDARSDKWTGLNAGTYHFRVCEYLGGACGIYSNDITVTVPGKITDNSNGTITLNGYYDQSLDKVRLEWTIGSLYSAKGFKVVESTQAYPVYPGNDYHYLSSPDARNDKWVDLSSGTHHFRVCEYLGGSCGIYSNDLTVTIP
ncbi:MAG: hypothetical protein GF365_01085 [Candidatus Buchananbacteria bacterium]|nr:hypothetical protein [Candidatus Buchananbacteria bacterium]